MGNLKTALDNLYNALLINKKAENEISLSENSNDCENIEKNFDKVINILCNKYKDKSQNTITDRRKLTKFETLQDVLISVVATQDIQSRKNQIENHIKNINSRRKHFTGTQAEIVAFLTKVKNNISSTRFFNGINLKTYQIIGKDNTIHCSVKCYTKAANDSAALWTEFDHSNIRLAMDTVNGTCDDLKGKCLNKDEVVDASRRLLDKFNKALNN